MARTRRPANEGTPLAPVDAEAAEAGLAQLERPAAIVAWCQAVGIPVDGAAKEVDDLRRFFVACGAKEPRAGWPACPGCPLDRDDLRRVEQELQALAVPLNTIAWCERKGIPVEGAARDCAELRQFFEAILSSAQGQQGNVTGSP